MIGDAVPAHFGGPRTEQRALVAGIAAIRGVEQAGLARRIGVGIYTGGVISGTIGPRDRLDFTVSPTR